MRIFLFCCLILIFSVNNIRKEVSGNIRTVKAITGLGQSYGNKTEKEIDKNGGKLRSFDGELELVIPEGAVTKKTTISIQPVTNKLILGTGKAYQLEPSGIEFKKPVQLTLRYTGDEVDKELQSLLGIAMQDRKGKWFESFNTRLDSVSGTITTNISHFSVWTKFMALKIFPRYTRLKVGKKLVLGIVSIKPQSPPESQEQNIRRGISMSGAKKGEESGSGEKDVTMEMGEIELVYEDAPSSGGKLVLIPPTADEIAAANPGVFDDDGSGGGGNSGKLVLIPPTAEEIAAANPGIFDDDGSGGGGNSGKLVLIPPTAEEIAAANPGVFDDGGNTMNTVELTIGQPKEAGGVELTIGEPKRAGEVELTVGDPKRVDNQGNTGETAGREIRSESAAAGFLSNYEAEWMVNGIKNGNTTFGTVHSVSATRAMYVAPKLVPDSNPVTVSVTLRGFDYKRKGRTISNPNLKSRILLYDNAYKVTVECEVNGADAGTRLGKVFYKDFGSFLVEVKKDKAEIKEIRNQSDYWNYVGSCECAPTAPGYGMVHVRNPAKIKVIPPPTENGNSKVEMEFPPMPASLTRLLISCPDAPALPFGGPFGGLAYPMYIKFEAKEGLQHILEQGQRGGEGWVAIDVKKLGDNSVFY